MKKLLITCLLAATCGVAGAQDLIVLRNAQDIEAKVLRVTPTQIEYQKWNNLQGPVYELPVGEILFIKYQNGTKEVFGEAPVVAPATTPAPIQQVQTQPQAQPQPQVQTQPQAQPQQPQPQGERYERNPRLATGAGPAHMPGQRMIRQPRFKHHNEKYPYYQGEFSVGYGIGMGAASREINTNRIVFETVHGARICPYFFAGAGLGLNYFHTGVVLYDNSYNPIAAYKGALVLPVFANAKGYLPLSGKCALYLSLDLGAAIPIGGWAQGTTQFYTSVGPGVELGNGRSHVRGNFSVRFQHMGTGLNAMLFRVGVNF